MDRQFDYNQKILLAVEFAATPRRMHDMPASYTLFRRIAIPDILRGIAAPGIPEPLANGDAFGKVLHHHMGYWESRVPAGHQCFVHYAIASDAMVTATFNRLKADNDRFVLLGIYHVEPQCSAYPGSFPGGDTPDHWHLGERFSFTRDSVFWFNFFPAQPYLFEKTFTVWSSYQLLRLRQRGENNQLVAVDSADRLIVHDVAEMVQVNLNRFTSIPGFVLAGQEAGKQTFTPDADYLWYGMLLAQVEAP